MLKGKVAVVTGGTRGIGLSIVKAYLDNGASVVLWGSKKESAEKAVAELLSQNKNYKVEGMYPNLTDAKEVELAINTIAERYAGEEVDDDEFAEACAGEFLNLQNGLFAVNISKSVYSV